MERDRYVFILLCVLQQQRLEHLEEKLRLMTESRDEAQNCCLKQKQMVAEAQAKAHQFSLHADGLRRQLEELQQVIWTEAELWSPRRWNKLQKLFGYSWICLYVSGAEQ